MGKVHRPNKGRKKLQWFRGRMSKQGDEATDDRQLGGEVNVRLIRRVPRKKREDRERRVTVT